VLENSTILVTGGTGSFGSKFIPMTLKNYNPARIIVYSRDEMKQWEMQQKYENDPRVRFFIGDVRDKDRLRRAFCGVDYVVHAAATKIVPTAEYNPFECIKTNVIGAMNVIDAALDAGVKRVVALSTDKASDPINLYGASKLSSDKLFVAGGVYSGSAETIFSVVRYGNEMGSRGSVIPYFRSLNSNRLPITHQDMTRFMITLEEGVELVWKAIEAATCGEIFVKKIPSMRVVDIAAAIRPDADLDFIGIRPGEKLHEQMIGVHDAPFTYDFGQYYTIYPNIIDPEYYQKTLAGGQKVPEFFSYSSDNNKDWMTIEFLQKWITETYQAKNE